jgi:hypothetical protein
LSPDFHQLLSTSAKRKEQHTLLYTESVQG